MVGIWLDESLFTKLSREVWIELLLTAQSLDEFPKVVQSGRLPFFCPVCIRNIWNPNYSVRLHLWGSIEGLLETLVLQLANGSFSMRAVQDCCGHCSVGDFFEVPFPMQQ